MPVASNPSEQRDDGLDVRQFAAEPIAQFRKWMDQAAAAGLRMPEAAALATATADGRPSVRMVLLKVCDERGFAFFTNYRSRKARELDANPFAALTFHWQDLERQVRIEGCVERVSYAESDAYFRTRPLDSRLGAWASPQSEVIADRHGIEREIRNLQNRFPDNDLPCPEFWGGYRIQPASVEFWQGRPGRLHDRLRYRFDHGWVLERLAP